MISPQEATVKASAKPIVLDSDEEEDAVTVRKPKTIVTSNNAQPTMGLTQRNAKAAVPDKVTIDTADSIDELRAKKDTSVIINYKSKRMLH